MRLGLLSALLLLAAAGPQDAPKGEPETALAQAQPKAPAELAFEWRADEAPLIIPRSERLTFRVRVGAVGIEAPVGVVTMSSDARPYRKGSVLLLGGGGSEAAGEAGWMQIHAAGDYQVFRMDAKIETTVQPTGWPWIVHNFEQSGSKKRRKETLIGWSAPTDGGDGGDGARAWKASYRSDTSRDAPKGERIWKEPKHRELPVPAIDMLSAAYYARTMVREDRLYMAFPVADKLDLWELQLKRGKKGRLEVPAGRFDAVQIILDPRPYPGEVPDEKVREKAETFEGLFGLQGSIDLWVEAHTGVPLLIAGDLPIGPLKLAISVSLQEYYGTPPDFRPLP